MSVPDIVIQPINVEEVVALDKERYNTNNHWIDGIRPADYKEVLDTGEATHWIDFFKPGYKTLTIKPRHLGWMKRACELGQQTKKFSRLFEDELEDLLAEHKEYDSLFDGTEYFVRTKTVSLKCGQHGAGPYRDLRTIMESALTTAHGHSPIHVNTEELVFYLIPWVQLDPDREFRVFICQNQITAISQQFTTKSNAILSALDEESRCATVRRWAGIIYGYWSQVVRQQITHVSSYSIDIALLGDEEQPFFIEINCFGKEYAAGSSLFHWLLDEDILYDLSKQEKIYFRYAV